MAKQLERRRIITIMDYDDPTLIDEEGRESIGTKDSDFWLDCDHLYHNGHDQQFVIYYPQTVRRVIGREDVWIIVKDIDNVTAEERDMLVQFVVNMENGDDLEMNYYLLPELVGYNSDGYVGSLEDACNRTKDKDTLPIIAYRGGQGYTYGFHIAAPIRIE